MMRKNIITRRCLPLLTALLQQSSDYNAWTQGVAYPVWDGVGGLEDYPELQ